MCLAQSEAVEGRRPERSGGVVICHDIFNRLGRNPRPGDDVYKACLGQGLIHLNEQAGGAKLSNPITPQHIPALCVEVYTESGPSMGVNEQPTRRFPSASGME